MISCKPAFFAAAGGFVALAGPLASQTANTPATPKITAFIASSLEANDNYDLREDSLGNALLWNNSFGAALTDSTPSDRFSLDASGTYRFSDLPEVEDQQGLDNQQVGFSYDRLGEDDKVSAFARYLRNELEFFDPLDDLDEDGYFDDTSSQGYRESIRTGLDLSLNQNAPISLGLSVGYDQVMFHDTTDPDFVDRENYRVRGELGLRVTPTLQATMGASYRQSDSTDDDVTSQGVNVGLNADFNEQTTGFFRIGYSKVESEKVDGTDIEEGVTGSVGFRSRLPDGSVGASLGSSIDENGPRVTFSVDRNKRLGNGYFDGNLGVSTSDETPIRLVGKAAFSRETTNGRFNASFSQQASTDYDGEDVLNTFVSVGYQRELSRVSSVNLGAQGGLIRYENSDRVDSERLNLTAQYNRSLTRDWGYNVGYRHNFRSNDEVQDARSNSIFFTLRRDFAALR